MTYDIEQKFILSLLRDGSKIAKAISDVPEESLPSESGKWLYHNTCEHFLRYGCVPTKTVIDTWLSNIENESTRQEHITYLKATITKDIVEKDFVFYLDSLVNNKTYQDMLTILENVSERINPTTVPEVMMDLEDALFKLRPSSNQRKVEYYDLGEIASDRIMGFQDVDENEIGIPTPIKALNEAIGGLKRSQLNVIAAPSGGGKSVFMLNFAEHAYSIGKNVVYITIEMSYEDCVARYHSLISSMDAKRILNKNLSTEEKMVLFYRLLEHQVDNSKSRAKLKEIFKRSPSELGIVPTAEELKIYGKIAHTKSIGRLFELTKDLQYRPNKFMIVDSPFGVTIPQLRANLKNLSNKFKLDLVVIDYLNIMSSGVKNLKDWEDAKYVSKALKQLAREFYVPILTACQIHPGTNKEGKLSQDDVRYSKAISENSDNVIAFRRSEKDEMLGIIRLELIKHRNSEFKSIPIREKFERMGIEEISGNI